MDVAPSKKSFTEQDQMPEDTSNASIPSDLTLQLRNVGSRVRRSVSQGYLVTPPSFTQHHSTGALWRSEKDTLRDVYANAPPSSSTAEASINKRVHARGEEAEDDENTDITRVMNRSLTTLELAMQPPAHPERVTKPLKRSWSRKAMSDSALAFGQATHARSNPGDRTTAFEAVEEEDWSLAQGDTSGGFQPVEL